MKKIELVIMKLLEPLIDYIAMFFLFFGIFFGVIAYLIDKELKERRKPP